MDDGNAVGKHKKGEDAFPFFYNDIAGNLCFAKYTEGKQQALGIDKQMSRMQTLYGRGDRST